MTSLEKNLTWYKFIIFIINFTEYPKIKINVIYSKLNEKIQFPPNLQAAYLLILDFTINHRLE